MEVTIALVEYTGSFVIVVQWLIGIAIFYREAIDLAVNTRR